MTYHDLDGPLKAAYGVFKSLGLHVGFSQENEQRSYGFHTSCSFKNFNGLQVKQRLKTKDTDTSKEPNLWPGKATIMNKIPRDTNVLQQIICVSQLKFEKSTVIILKASCCSSSPPNTTLKLRRNIQS